MSTAVRVPVLVLSLLAASLACVTSAAAAAGPLTVEGRVVSDAGAGLGEIEVTLHELSSRAERIDQPLARAFTDASGRFSLTAPRPGFFLLRVSAPGFAPFEARLSPLFEPLVLPELRLVTATPLGIRVTDAAGSPVSGALVRLDASPRGGSIFAEDALWTIAPQFARTDAGGRVRMALADDARMRLAASHPDHGARLVEPVRGSDVGVSLDQSTASLHVQTVDHTGAPVAGCLVSLGEARMPVGRTGADGEVTLALPHAAPFELAATAADGRSSVRRVSAGDFAGTPDSGRESRPVILRLPGLVDLPGRVLDASSRSGVDGALVWAGWSEPRAATTGGGGHFVVRVPAGEPVSLRAAAPGYLPLRSSPVPLPLPSSHGATLALQPAATVEGVVTSAEDGQPVAGAELTLEERRAPTGNVEIRIGGPSELPVAATTDAAGRFRLTGIDPARPWGLLVKGPGFAPARVDLGALDPRRPLRDVSVTLEPGHTVTGTLEDEAGRPVPGATVTLSHRARIPGMGGVRVISPGGDQGADIEAASDRSGRFTLKGVPEGHFGLTVERAGFATHDDTTLHIEKETGDHDAGVIVLAPEEVVQGFVSTRAGEPIEGVSVRANPSGEEAMFVMAGAAGQEPDTRSDPAGWFVVGGLAEGDRVDLSLERAGYLRKSVPGVQVPPDMPLEITLDPASSLTGYVLDGDGAGIAGATVRLARNTAGGMGGRTFVMRMVVSEETDQDGRFVFEDLEPGDVDLDASAPGFKTASRTVTIPEGEDVEGVELPLEPGSRVVGQVTLADGRPAVGARVRVVEEGEMPFMPGGAEADGDGWYALDGLEEGPASIEARTEGGQRVVRDLEVGAGTNRLDLALEGGRTVSGTVVTPGGGPLSGATVRLGARDGLSRGADEITDASGRFTFEGVQEGAQVVRASHPDWAGSKEVPVPAGTGPLNDLVVPLRQGGTIEGFVRGLSAEEMRQVSLEAYAALERDFRTAVVDRQGNFRLENLAPGTWELRAAIESLGRQARAQATVDPGGGVASAELVFGGGLTLRGLVLENDEPVGGAAVTVQGIDQVASGWGRTDHEGRFVIDDLEPGRYRLMLRQWSTGLGHEEELDLQGDEDITIEIPVASVAGVVVDAVDDAPLAGVSVRVAPADASDASGTLPFGPGSTTDLDGRFSIGPLTDGRWRLIASKKGFASVSQPFTITGGDAPADVKLRMDPTEGLTMTVRLASGAIPDRVTLAVLDPSGAPIVQGSYGTGEGGRVRVSGVPQGTWETLVSAAGSATVPTTAQSPGGSTAVSIPPACRLHVTVPELVDAAVPAWVTLTDERGITFRSLGWLGSIETRWGLSSGQALLDDVPPGAWTVNVTAADGRTWTAPATAAPGQTTKVSPD